LVDPDHGQIPVIRQCEILGLRRSSYYYQRATETPLNLELMRVIDEQYLKMPFYGVPRMTPLLRNMGYLVNHKRGRTPDAPYGASGNLSQEKLE
jgi:putative transposase